jgi:hypothetical protein
MGFNGIVIREITDSDINGKRWYLIKNDELGLVNHWVPEHMLESYKKTLREGKLKELGI